MSKWKTVRVFISSTFRDMHAERDHLVKVTFPHLRQWCEERQLHLADIDLRWGVTREEAENGKAVDICLKEIDGSRPFFVCLLGERYGYVPELPPAGEHYFGLEPAAGLSVTHLEIIHAAENPFARADGKLQKPCPHAFFYFRQRNCIPVEGNEYHRRTFFEESAEMTAKLDILKSDIRSRFTPQGRVFDYSGEWDPKAENPEDKEIIGRLGRLDALGDRIETDLKQAISEQFADHISSIGKRNALEDERWFHETLIENLTQVHIPRADVEQKLSAYAEGGDACPMVLSGPAGSGKSAVLAHWVQGRENVIIRFVGASPASASLTGLLGSICEELLWRFDLTERATVDEASFDVPMRIPADPIELQSKWLQFLEAAGMHGPVVIVLDAINQLERSVNPRNGYWIPSVLPANVRLIVSVIDHADEAHSQDWLSEFRRRRLPEIQVPPLTDSDRYNIIRELPSIFCKSLDTAQINLLLKNKATRNPLFLTVALNELRVSGSFEQLPTAISALPQFAEDGNIEVALEQLFGQVLDRLDHESMRFTPGLAPKLFSLIASSRDGLSELELSDLIACAMPAIPEKDRDGFLQIILRQVRPYLQRKQAQGAVLVDFYHRSLWKSVTKKYLSSDEEKGAVHVELADYFAGLEWFSESQGEQRARAGRLPPTPRPVVLRKIFELPWQRLESARLLGKGDADSPYWDTITSLLMDWNFLEAKAEAEGMLIHLIQDFNNTIRIMPQGCLKRPILVFIEEAIHREILFISEHPTSLFQTLWHTCWWYDSLQSNCFLDRKNSQPTTSSNENSETGLYSFMESWALNKFTENKWLRSKLPPAHMLGKGPAMSLKASAPFAFSPDGRYLAGGRTSLEIWDLETNLRVMTISDKKVDYFEFTGDGTKLALKTQDDTVCFYDIVSGDCLFSKAYPGCCSVAPDADRILVMRRDGSFAVIDLLTDTIIAELRYAIDRAYAVIRNNSPVRTGHISRDGKTIVTGELVSQDKPSPYRFSCFMPIWMLGIWNVGESIPRQTICSGSDMLRHIAVSQDKSHVIWQNKTPGSLIVWDIPDNKLRTIGQGESCREVGISMDGMSVVGWDRWNDSMHIYDVGTGESACEINGPNPFVSGLVITNNRALVVSAGTAGTFVWNARRISSCSDSRVKDEFLSPVTLLPDNHTIAVPNQDNKLVLWDLDKMEYVGGTASPLDNHITVMAAPNNQRIVLGGRYGSLEIWDIEKMRLIKKLKGHKGFIDEHSQDLRAIDVSIDRKYVITTSGWQDPLMIWSIRSMRRIGKIRTNRKYITDVMICPDGQCIVITEETVRLYDTKSGRCINTILGQNDSFSACAVTPDGKSIMVGESDGTIKGRNMADNTCFCVFKGTDKGIKRIIISPDGERMVTYGARDLLPCIWNIRDMNCEGVLKGHTQEVFSVCISADGQYVISTSSDQTIRMWDIRTREEILCFSCGYTSFLCDISPRREIVVSVVAGEGLPNYIQIFSPENVVHGPIIATAWHREPYFLNRLLKREAGGEYAFGCPICRKWSQISEDSLGAVVQCPSCDASIRLNSFVIQKDWSTMISGRRIL